jgi:quercetin dioxygenase-like cupin family protein
MPFGEAEAQRAPSGSSDLYQRWLERSRASRAAYESLTCHLSPSEMPWEDAPQGRIRHVINEEAGTREMAIDVYLQEIPAGGRSGKHRHLAEELLFVLSGRGYDLHWDPRFELDVRYSWSWEEQPKRWEWAEGDFIYVPPYVTHQHFNADPDQPARLISATNRLVKAMGFDWLEQVEDAPGYRSGRN